MQQTSLTATRINSILQMFTNSCTHSVKDAPLHIAKSYTSNYTTTYGQNYNINI